MVEEEPVVVHDVRSSPDGFFSLRIYAPPLMPSLSLAALCPSGTIPYIQALPRLKLYHPIRPFFVQNTMSTVDTANWIAPLQLDFGGAIAAGVLDGFVERGVADAGHGLV